MWSFIPPMFRTVDGAFHLLRRARRLFPFIEVIFADGGYAGRKMALTVWRTGVWKFRNSSSDLTLLGSRFCQNGGLSRGRSHGSVVTVAWLATLSATQQLSLRSFASP